MKNAFILGLFVLTLLALPVVASAQTQNCTIIYGGGKIDCAPKEESTTQPTPTAQPIQVTTNNQTTKGGLPVEQPVQAATTPGTGPEMLGLISLIPAAATGIWIRKKTQ